MRKLIILLAALVFAACGSESEKGEAEVSADSTPTTTVTVPKEQLLTTIKENSNALTNLYNPDSLRFIAGGQVKMCEEYVSSYPTDPEAALILTYKAKAYSVLGLPKEAVNTYSRVIGTYGEYDDMPQVLFLKGFILDEDLNDDKAAEAAYQDLIQKYPNHKLSKDARALLTKLYMTDEQLIKSFEAKNK